MDVAEDHVLGLDPEPFDDDVHRLDAGAADLGDREVAVEAAEPGSLHAAERRRDHGGAEQPAADRSGLPGGAADRLPDPHRAGPPVDVAAEATAALGEAEDQVVDGSVHLFVVVRRLAAARDPSREPVDGGDREALDGRQRDVAVEVVAVGREDVVAHPVARIANLEPGIAQPIGDRPDGGMGGDDQLVEGGGPLLRRGPARARGRAGGDRGCRGRGSTSPPANASPIASKKARVLASDSPSGPSRSSTVSPSRTRRSASTAANASSNRSRIAARRSTSQPGLGAEVQVGDQDRGRHAQQSSQLVGAGRPITGND